MRSRLRPFFASIATSARSEPLGSASMRASTKAEMPRARAFGMDRNGRRATTVGRVVSLPASSGHHGAESASIGAGTTPIVVVPARTAASVLATAFSVSLCVWMPIRSPGIFLTTSPTIRSTSCGSVPPLVSHSTSQRAPAFSAAARQAIA